MLGSLTLYRRELHRLLFPHHSKLPTAGHALAGIGAGWTVSFIAAPVEHVKARLQVQYAAERSARLYSGPIDCSSKIVSPFPPSLLPSSPSPPSPPSLTPLAPHPRHFRPLPRPIRHPLIPDVFLRLVGQLRRPNPPLHPQHRAFHTRHQLLGRRVVRTVFLAGLLSLGCRQAAAHDGSAGRTAE
jgi:Mitochondrial carrier protein